MLHIQLDKHDCNSVRLISVGAMNSLCKNYLPLEQTQTSIQDKVSLG